MKWIAYILGFLAGAYLTVAIIYTGIVVILGGNITTAFAVGILWPMIFWK